jgi:hypothetical protein
MGIIIITICPKKLVNIVCQIALGVGGQEVKNSERVFLLKNNVDIFQERKCHQKYFKNS